MLSYTELCGGPCPGSSTQGAFEQPNIHPPKFTIIHAMSLHGLGVIGAQVAASIKGNDEKPPSTPKIHSPSCSVQSTPSLNDTRSQEFDPHDGAKPCSPFYRHGSPTVSYEQITLEPKNDNTPRYGTQLQDIENAGPYPALTTESSRRSKLWEPENPKKTWMQSLSRRQRMTLKAVLAVVIVGTMIAIALGITAAVGGATWRKTTKQAALND